MRWIVVGPTSQLAKWPPKNSDGSPLACNAAIASPLTISTRPAPSAQMRRRCGCSATARPRLSHMPLRMRWFSASLLPGMARRRLRRAMRVALRRGPMVRPMNPPTAEAQSMGRQAKNAITAMSAAASPPSAMWRPTMRRPAIHGRGGGGGAAFFAAAAIGGSDKRLPDGKRCTGDDASRSPARTESAGRSQLSSPALVEEEVDAQLFAALHGVALEIADSGLAQHVLVEQEAAGEAAAVARQHDMRRVGHDLGLAAGLRLRARDDLQRRGGDGGARPQRVDGDAVLAEFLGHAEDAQAHAVFGDGVGDMRPEPPRVQVERRRQRQDMRVGRALQMRQAGARAEISAAQIDADHQVEALHRRLERAGEADGRGVVDEDVDAAEALDRRLDRAHHLVFLADVGLAGKRLAARLLYRLGCRGDREGG